MLSLLTCAFAASARLPYVSLAFVGASKTTPFSARQDFLSTLHFCAAASTSISRAAAPALRMGSQDERTLELPPVPCMPNAGLKYSFAAGANSVRIFFQSHSSSSAAIMQRAV